jgi:FKBP-type peptidyl-prolyl cis-trans isomerase FkpA
MKVGGKAVLVCPASIAYGENGKPPVIPGGATLVFEIELLEVGGN